GEIPPAYSAAKDRALRVGRIRVVVVRLEAMKVEGQGFRSQIFGSQTKVASSVIGRMADQSGFQP
ncbi:MAG: hypothetical protein ACLP00_22060, partial [Terracidiphilus sp.]